MTSKNIHVDAYVTHDPHDTAGEVYAMYDGLLGRAPDDLGLEDWTDHLKSGMSLRDLAQALLDSPEGRERAGAEDNAGFVQQLYKTTLHRDGDSDGAHYWEDSLNSHTLSRAEVAMKFAMSPEHLNNIHHAYDDGIRVTDKHDADVERLYHSVMDRDPDSDGLQYYTAQVKHGMSLHDVAQKMLDSHEYEHKSTGVSDTEYVQHLYRDLLGRGGDSAGQQSWTHALENGEDRADVAKAFLGSPEYHAHTDRMNSSQYVDALYKGLLGHHGDDEGAHYWADALDHHLMTREDVEHAFMYSSEYQNKYVTPSNTSFVHELYEHALGRDADDNGLHAWVDKLEHGMARADVAVAIAESPEAHHHLAYAIEHDWHVA
jgi:hypothetical protein